MRDDLAQIVFPVLHAGLRLKERVLSGPRPGNGVPADRLATEHAKLRGLLLNEAQALRDTDYGGDTGNAPDRFRGARYALAVWLDEMFILNVPANSECFRWWNAEQLETILYGDGLFAYSRFWEQARLADVRGHVDALEVYYLCVMLGFRGQHRDQPAEVLRWRGDVERQLRQKQATDWPSKPAEVAPETDVPPLVGRDRLRRRLLWLALCAAPLVLCLAFILIRSFV